MTVILACFWFCISSFRFNPIKSLQFCCLPLPAFFQAFHDDTGSVLHFKRKKRTLKCSSKKRKRSTKKLSLPFRLKIKHELSARPRKKNKNRSMTTKHGTDLCLRNFYGKEIMLGVTVKFWVILEAKKNENNS